MIMGKEQCNIDGPKTCVLKFDMHCQCHGCIKKINDGLKDISLSEGVESTDLLLETGEVKVTGRMDPEKLCSMLRSVTKKCVQIVTQSTLSEGPRALAQQNKNLYGQAPPDWLAREPEPSSGWQNGAGKFQGLGSSGWQNGVRTSIPVTPSAPPLPEESWSETVPSERCWYRWSASSSSLGVWAASEITGTLAMYEL